VLGGPRQTNPDALWLYQTLKEEEVRWVGEKNNVRASRVIWNESFGLGGEERWKNAAKDNFLLYVPRFLIYQRSVKKGEM